MLESSGMRTEKPYDSSLDPSQLFLSRRLRYYSDRNLIVPETPLNLSQQVAIEKLQILKPAIIVVTATNNRLSKLKEAYAVLVDQHLNVNWSWLIIDNLSSDHTIEYFEGLKDNRVVVAKCESTIGCAYPVRNCALDLVSSALRINCETESWVTIIDSDDRLFDTYSLHEMLEMTKSRYGQSKGLALVHGYSDTIIHYQEELTEHVANPRDTSSSFPRIDKLSEVNYKGLNILAGAFPAELLSWFRYPPERSFEDAAFNEKLMLQGLRSNLVWLAKDHPLTVKHFHRESMSGINNKIGDQEQRDKIGPYVVTGIRAQIVKYYRHVIDYFVREEL